MARCIISAAGHHFDLAFCTRINYQGDELFSGDAFMTFKALMAAGAAIALLSASSSYAAAPAKPMVAKDTAKIAQIGRAHALMINNKRNLAADEGRKGREVGEGGGGVSRSVLIALAAGATGLGIAAAAGAFNSSK
ncbi:MAG: hypothetical protein NVSMB6_14540 [Burkholderiaceae bacterium]